MILKIRLIGQIKNISPHLYLKSLSNSWCYGENFVRNNHTCWELNRLQRFSISIGQSNFLLVNRCHVSSAKLPNKCRRSSFYGIYLWNRSLPSFPENCGKTLAIIINKRQGLIRFIFWWAFAQIYQQFTGGGIRIVFFPRFVWKGVWEVQKYLRNLEFQQKQMIWRKMEMLN